MSVVQQLLVGDGEQCRVQRVERQPEQRQRQLEQRYDQAHPRA